METIQKTRGEKQSISPAIIDRVTLGNPDYWEHYFLQLLVLHPEYLVTQPERYIIETNGVDFRLKIVKRKNDTQYFPVTISGYHLFIH